MRHLLAIALIAAIVAPACTETDACADTTQAHTAALERAEDAAGRVNRLDLDDASEQRLATEAFREYDRALVLVQQNPECFTADERANAEVMRDELHRVLNAR